MNIKFAVSNLHVFVSTLLIKTTIVIDRTPVRPREYVLVFED